MEAKVDSVGRAIVALAAMTNHCALATRDARALATYQALGVEIEVVA